MKKTFSFLTLAVMAVFSSIAEAMNAGLFRYQARAGFIACMDEVPTGFDFDSRRVTNSSQSEVVRQRLYDYQLYPAAGVAQLTFFSAPAGQGITTAQGAVVGSAKTLWDTNLELPNTLPSGKSYLIQSIEVLILPGSVATANTYTPANLSLFAVAAAATVAAQLNDINTLYQSGMLELNILSKNYLRETPLLPFPPKAHLDVSAALANTSATVGLAAGVFGKASGRPYYLSPEITLQPAVNFEVAVKYPAAVAAPSGFNGRIGVILDGYFMRASQ